MRSRFNIQKLLSELYKVTKVEKHTPVRNTEFPSVLFSVFVAHLHRCLHRCLFIIDANVVAIHFKVSYVLVH